MNRIVSLALPLVLALFVAACARNEAAPAPQLPQVSVAAVVEREVADWDEFTGRIEAVESVEVRPRVTGYLERIHFTEGSEVKKGDLLFTIDPRPYQAELGRAEAELARAQTRAELGRNEVARSEKLLSVRALSVEEHDQRVNAAREAAASVRAAQAAVDTARLNLGFTRVTSPIDGRVSKATVTVGNLVNGGSGSSTLLTTVVSVDPIYVSFEGDEQTYLKHAEFARRGQPKTGGLQNRIQVALANETEFSHEGRLVFVDNQLDPTTGTIRARALLENKDRRFTPGLFARVRLMGSSRYSAVLIDDRAVGTDQSQKFVYVVDAQNTVSYRAVKLGRSTEGMRIVESGLQAGELIVVNGLQRVMPGVTIAPQRVSMDRSPGGSKRLAQVFYQ